MNLQDFSARIRGNLATWLDTEYAGEEMNEIWADKVSVYLFAKEYDPTKSTDLETVLYDYERAATQ